MSTRVDGPLQVIESGLILPKYVAIGNVPTSTEDVFTFYADTGMTVPLCTVTITYTDDTKSTLLSVVKEVP